MPNQGAAYRFATVVVILVTMLILQRHAEKALDSQSLAHFERVLVVVAGVTLIICMYVVIPWIERKRKRPKD